METVTRLRWWLECVLAFIGTSIIFWIAMHFSIEVLLKGIGELVPVEHSPHEIIMLYLPEGVFSILFVAAVAGIRALREMKCAA